MSALIARFAPWSLIALAVAGVVIWGLWGRLEAANTKLDAANAVIEQAEKDKVANAKAVQQLAQKLTDTETKVVTVTEKVYAAPVTRDCAQSPAMRAASDGLRQLFPVGQADDRRQPAPAVPGPAVGAGRTQR
jgi:hypothetical protein